MPSARMSGSVRRLFSLLLLLYIAQLDEAPANTVARGKDRFFGRDTMEAAAGRWATPVRSFLLGTLVGDPLDEDPRPSCRTGQIVALTSLPTRIGAWRTPKVAAHGPSCRCPPERKGRLGATRTTRTTSRHLQARSV